MASNGEEVGFENEYGELQMENFSKGLYSENNIGGL